MYRIPAAAARIPLVDVGLAASDPFVDTARHWALIDRRMLISLATPRVLCCRGLPVSAVLNDARFTLATSASIVCTRTRVPHTTIGQGFVTCRYLQIQRGAVSRHRMRERELARMEGSWLCTVSLLCRVSRLLLFASDTHSGAGRRTVVASSTLHPCKSFSSHTAHSQQIL